MTHLQKMMFEYIPSETMHRYLAEKMSSGEFEPSFEDMAATVFNCGGDIFRNADYYRSLLKEELSENTRKELEWHIGIADNMRKYIENKDGRYAFECSSCKDDLRAVCRIVGVE
ncbi:MAG: hypothetical protein ACI4JJ_03170 [Huintestinicola sp.]